MRLSAAAVVVLAIGITVFLITPGSQGTTWAEVVKAIGPIESMQYRTVDEGQGGQRVTTQNYVTATMTRVDTWLQHAGGVAPDKTPNGPDQIHIMRTSGREITAYSVELQGGRPVGIHQSIAYSVLASPPDVTANLGGDGAQVLEMWRRLQTLSPESVLKRGSETVDGQRGFVVQ